LISVHRRTASASGKRPAEKQSVNRILLTGVFWRILIIEGILLVGSVLYRAVSEGEGTTDLLWYTLRIIFLVGIIILFMMVTLRRFLRKKVITSLEIIAEANRRFQENAPEAGDLQLPEDAPAEIRDIVTTRRRMLETILQVSKERLNLAEFIKETFGRYVPRSVVEEILKSPEGRQLGGRKKTVTILMSDLRGFTYLSEFKDPEEIVAVLNRYLESMTHVILSYDGIIDEFIGDAILAIFGGPEEKADDPARAVACAIAMQNALADLNKSLAEKEYPPLEMGIGINTGTVVVGNIGSEIRTKYGIVGSAVNITARIQADAVGGQVLVGESTYEALKSTLTVDTGRTVVAKGLKKPLVYYLVRAIGAPYHLSLEPAAHAGDDVPIRLDFKYQRVENGKVLETGGWARTESMSDNTICAILDPPLPPLSNIKISFDFCRDAYCFEDIYAKVTECREDRKPVVNRLNITAISPTDRDMLKKWLRELA